jgi:hypothetical protein
VHQEADVQGVHIACGGASLDDQQAMSAKGYPVTLKLAGANGQWLGDENLTVAGGGQKLSFGCEGPWVGLQLPGGSYRVTAEIQGAPAKTVSFSVGKSGARDVMIRFPEKTEAAGAPPPAPQ